MLLLKECYELAAQYEEPGIAREVLRARADGCQPQDVSETDTRGMQRQPAFGADVRGMQQPSASGMGMRGMQQSASGADVRRVQSWTENGAKSGSAVLPSEGREAAGSPMQLASEALLALTQDGYTASGDAGYLAEQWVSMLPDSAEKEYLLALLALREGRAESQRIEAMRHISRAMDLSPGDPRYLTLAEVLGQP